MQEFIENWYGAVKPGDGYSQKEVDDAEARLGFRLPAALREWYQLAGRRFDVWCRTLGMYFFEPKALGVEFDGIFVFRMDDFEGYVSWGIRVSDLGKDDPSIWGINAPDLGYSPSVFECTPTTTLFAIQSMLEEMSMNNPFCSAYCEADWSEYVRSTFQKCDFTIGPYWNAIDSSVLEVFEGLDTVVRLGNHALSVTARTEEAFARLDPSLRKELQRAHRPGHAP
jgi:hypothetical protein